jgi:hypothetical protein
MIFCIISVNSCFLGPQTGFKDYQFEGTASDALNKDHRSIGLEKLPNRAGRLWLGPDPGLSFPLRDKTNEA